MRDEHDAGVGRQIQDKFQQECESDCVVLVWLLLHHQQGEATNLVIGEHEKRDWADGAWRKREKEENNERALVPKAGYPPALQRCGSIMCLQGELEEATFGPVNHHVNELPAGNRPQRWLHLRH